MGRILGAPTELADCAMWFDAGQGVTQSGGLVSQWNDVSGNGRHIAQPSDPLKPTYRASNPAFAGKPTVDWLAAGIGTRLDAVVPETIAQPLTVFACASLAVDTVSSALFDNASGSAFGLARVNSPTITWSVFPGSYMFPGPPGPSLGRPFVLAMHNGMALAFARVNRVSWLNLRGLNSAPVGVTSFRLGSFSSRFPLNNWVGPIAEFIVYSRLLTDGDVTVVEAYLQRKYGL